MRLCRLRLPSGESAVGCVTEAGVRVFDVGTLSELLNSDAPLKMAQQFFDASNTTVGLEDVQLLAPMDAQEVWAAGVTYTRSKEARMEESEGAARFYDLVYTAKRPELFFKATPHRVAGPGGDVRIRADSNWSVPEPELGLVLSPTMKLVGYTIGNDMSARDIEGENPLYLPQAKVYDDCCAIGPVVALVEDMPPYDQIKITLTIERGQETVFNGSVSAGRLARTLEELIGWLAKENSFPNGVILLNGTGVVPPDAFTLQRGDVIHIDATGIGRLSNIVQQREPS